MYTSNIVRAAHNNIHSLLQVYSNDGLIHTTVPGTIAQKTNLSRLFTVHCNSLSAMSGYSTGIMEMGVAVAV